MLAGALLATLHAWLCIRWRADQVVSGMALNLVMLALGTFLLEARFSPNGTPSITQLTRYGTLSVIGGHTALTWLALAAPFAIHALIHRTRFGLRLRAAGENPQALAAVGTVGLLVKKPGNFPWVSQADAATATAVRVFRCADGETPEEVEP
jgi:simple sugar transport system permease protein